MGVNCSENGIVGIHDILRNMKWKVYGCKSKDCRLLQFS